ARAKAWLLGNLAMDRRTSARHAWYLAFYELVGGGWEWPERFARAVDGVTVGDLTRGADRYLAQPTVVVLRPAERARGSRCAMTWRGGAWPGAPPGVTASTSRSSLIRVHL